jgi:hypothetical protein
VGAFGAFGGPVICDSGDQRNPEVRDFLLRESFRWEKTHQLKNQALDF